LKHRTIPRDYIINRRVLRANSLKGQYIEYRYILPKKPIIKKNISKEHGYTYNLDKYIGLFILLEININKEIYLVIKRILSYILYLEKIDISIYK
jgi:hypothetical protein